MVTSGAFVATPPPPANGFSVGPAPVSIQVEPPYIPCVWGDIRYVLLWAKETPVGAPAPDHRAPRHRERRRDRDSRHDGAGGQQDVEYGTMSAVRVTLGTWFDSDRCIGLEGNVLRSENKSKSNTITSTAATDQPLLIPFRNRTSNAEAAGIVANPPVSTGLFSMVNTFQFGSAEANGLLCLGRSDCCEFDFLLGARYMRLEESLGITTQSSVAVSNVTTTKFDDFVTRDEFFGGQIGGKLSFRTHNLYFDTTALLAVGNTHQTLTVAGLTGRSTTSTGAALGTPTLGGNFTSATNIRQDPRDELSLVPTFQMKAGVNLSSNLSVFAAYDFLYWTPIIRPGDQVDPHAGAVAGPAVQQDRLLGPGGVGRSRDQVLIRDPDSPENEPEASATAYRCREGTRRPSSAFSSLLSSTHLIKPSCVVPSPPAGDGRLRAGESSAGGEG